MTDIQSRLNLCDVNEYACVDDDTDESWSYSTDSMSAIHKLSTSMSSMTTADADAVQDIPDDNRLHRIPTLAASVKINVEGAFIVDDESDKEDAVVTEHVHWERKDIRLPYHTDVVSHVAVDVRPPFRAQLSSH